MRCLATLLAVFLLLTLPSSSQTATYCDNDCSVPWTVAPMRSIDVVCDGITYAMNFWFQYRTGCTGEPEFFVLAFEMSPAFHSPPCTVDGLIAEAMLDIVRRPPDGVPLPSKGDCADIWRLSTSNCWGRYEREEKHPQMRGCNGACCWARFKVCNRNGVNTIINRVIGGTLNLPGCGNPVDPTSIFECTTICSQLWDHFPGDNNGSGSKLSIGEHQAAEREIASSADLVTFNTVHVSFLPVREGRYVIVLFDNLGREIGQEAVDCRGGQTASVDLPLARRMSSTLFYTISDGGATVGTGVVVGR